MASKKGAKKRTSTGSPKSAASRRKRKVLQPRHWSLAHPASRVVMRAMAAMDSVPKEIAVAAAVGAQLRKEGKWPPNDANRTMASYDYNVNSLTNFMVAVRGILGMNGLVFNVSPALAAACLPVTVTVAVATIDAATTQG
jgi:hypothetical protein